MSGRPWRAKRPLQRKLARTKEPERVCPGASEPKVEGIDGTTACRWSKKRGDDFCSGCKRFICENHTINSAVMGFGHDPCAHLKWPEEPEEED